MSLPNGELVYLGAHFYYLGQVFVNGLEATHYISWYRIIHLLSDRSCLMSLTTVCFKGRK